MRTAALALALVACTRSEPVPQVPPPPSPEVQALKDAKPFIRVTGEQLIEAVKARDARFVVVNVWATWCGPCREEFPYVQSVTRSFADRGVDLIFVSTDFEEEEDAALEFLSEQGADLPSYIRTGKDGDFIQALNPEWGGALPTTIIFDDQGRRVRAWLGKVSETDLRNALQELTS